MKKFRKITRSDLEITAMLVCGRALDAIPKAARLRALAFLTSRALDVGSWVGSEILYKHASLAEDGPRET